MKKQMSILIMCIIFSIFSISVFGAVEPRSIDELAEKLSFLEMDGRNLYSDAKNDIINQIEEMGSEVYEFNDLPNNDPLKKHILNTLAQKAEPSWSTTNKTTVIKTRNTYGGKEFLTYEFIPKNGHSWIKNYPNLKIESSKIGINDIFEIYINKAVGEVIGAVTGPYRWLPYELLGFKKDEVTSYNTAHVTLTQSTHIKFVFRKRGTNDWDLLGAANKMLVSYNMTAQGVKSNGQTFVKSSDTKNVTYTANRYSDMYKILTTTNFMNTSSVPSATLLNTKNNYKIKTLSPNFTQVPASALE